MIKGKLKHRWLKLWERVGARGDGEVVFDRLAYLYGQPSRTYHNLSHIGYCLDKYKLIKDRLFDPDAVEMAIWFHDAIHDRDANKEERSAALAEEVLKAVNLPAIFWMKVTALVLATKHTQILNDIDSCFMVDIDLSILGEKPKRFDQYERQIREEYDWVTPEKFAAGRIAVLSSLLNSRHIFSTNFFRQRFETQAILNINRSIAGLSK